MRQFAAIIVIILISSAVESSTDKKVEFDFDDDLPTRSSSIQREDAVKTKDEKTQKDSFGGLGRCPLCDSSVYSYCDFKIFHDACCCGLIAPQCQYSDCSYLHANSCEEHQLITKCCCYNPNRNI